MPYRDTPLRSPLALEQAARSGSEDAMDRVLGELLDDAHIATLARDRFPIWLQHPEVVVADFFARMLEFSALASARQRWSDELDARGPWLRALRPIAWDRQPTVRLLDILPAFSPDGARLVDGPELFDGRTGAHVAALQIGGVAMTAVPWFHIGTELFVYDVIGPRFWHTKTGEPVNARPDSDHHMAHWHSVAYSRCGKVRAHSNLRTTSVVELHELPSMKPLGFVKFSRDERNVIALSADTNLIAVLGEQRVEVRRRDGSLVYLGRTPRAVSKQNGRTSRLIFLDEHGLALCSITEKDVRVWRFDEGPTPKPMPASTLPFPTSPPGWSIEAGSITRFVHADGRRVSVACHGPWVVNPIAPNILACPGGMFELRDGEIERSPGA